MWHTPFMLTASELSGISRLLARGKSPALRLKMIPSNLNKRGIRRGQGSHQTATQILNQIARSIATSASPRSARCPMMVDGGSLSAPGSRPRKLCGSGEVATRKGRSCGHDRYFSASTECRGLVCRPGREPLEAFCDRSANALGGSGNDSGQLG